MKNVFEDIEYYMQTRELIISFLLTAVFLFLSFVGYTQLSTAEITVIEHQGTIWERPPETHTIHMSCYGFPFGMMGVFNPLDPMENYWMEHYAGGLVQILWDGLFLNFVLYFFLAFAIVYVTKRLNLGKI
jgi:hypothetical protein